MILIYLLMFFTQGLDIFSETDKIVKKSDMDSFSHRYKSINLLKFRDKIEEISSVLELQKVSMSVYQLESVIKKIHVRYEGIKQDSESIYYFKNSKLIYVLKKQIDYESYKSDDSFDANKFSFSENSYYINEAKLIRWVNPEKRIIESPKIIMMTQEAIINQDVKVYLAQINP